MNSLNGDPLAYRKAIVTGATGMVGLAVAKHLAGKGLDVLCLGRRQLSNDEITTMFGVGNVSYLPLDMRNIESLPEAVHELGWEPSDSCIFYNFAWSGSATLTDGDFEHQFKNAIYCAWAVSAAKRLGCSKFVNAGTMEETFAERYLRGEVEHPNTSQINYAISKLAARDMSKMIAYLDKIDYVHTRLSVPLDENLSRGGYVSSVLGKILRGESYDQPQSDQLFDIVLTEDVAAAYFHIGQAGRNKADYFIGTSRPHTLRQYFEISERIRERGSDGYPTVEHADLSHGIFSIRDLLNDTDFVPLRPFEAFFHSLVTS